MQDDTAVFQFATLEVGGETLERVAADDIDVASLLVDLVPGNDAIPRATLATEWKALPRDRAKAAAKYAARDRGSLDAARLKDALAHLEKWGFVRRFGEPPRHAVEILNRQGLVELVEAWDAE